ncbi:unnamed protein product [Knipowitschia caucasica]
MKPASYQSIASSVMNPNLNLGHLLSTPNLMQCEKCSFATTDLSTFKKHIAQEHTEYYCFYCNRVSLSEAELQTHMKIHTGASPFKCPHCGQVYMRRMCLIKHIDRLHSKIPQEPPKKISHVSVSSASQSLPSTADGSSHRPVVRVTVPTPSTAGVALDTNLQRLKSLSAYMSSASHSNTVPLNGQTQRNRALTVPLPEEVSIPAGCVVEVAEVKTVDGTKELRLRFVAQENDSGTTNGRTTVPDTSKILLSQIKRPNAASESGTRFVNKNSVTKERPSLVPVNISKCFPNQAIKEQRLNSKRPSDVITLDAGVPNKISRSFSTIGESMVATQKEAISHNIPATAMSSMLASRLTANNMLTGNALKGVEERRTHAPGFPTTSEIKRMNNAQIMAHIVSMNRGPTVMKAKENPIPQTNRNELTKAQQQSLKTLHHPLKSLVAPQIRGPNECKDNFVPNVPKSFIPEQNSSPKVSTEKVCFLADTNASNSHMKQSALPQEVKTEKNANADVRAEREGFPVIYSVYSLSHQPNEPQESTQPIVMAEWTNSTGCDSPKIKSVRTGHQTPTDSTQINLTYDTLSNNICESVKVEDQVVTTAVTPQNIHLRMEKTTPMKMNRCVMDPKVNKSCSPPLQANVTKTCSSNVTKTCSSPVYLHVNNKTNVPLVQVKENITNAPTVHVNGNDTSAPNIQLKANNASALTAHANGNDSSSPTLQFKANNTSSPSLQFKANNTSSPSLQFKANNTSSPSLQFKANNTSSPSLQFKANNTSSPSLQFKANNTSSPSLQFKANNSSLPSAQVKSNNTSSPTLRVNGNDTSVPTVQFKPSDTPLKVKVNKKNMPPVQIKVDKTHVQPQLVNKKCALQEDATIGITNAATKNRKSRKNVSKQIKTTKSTGPVKASPSISLPPFVTEISLPKLDAKSPVTDAAKSHDALAANGLELSSKILTISLKRVKVGFSGKTLKKSKIVSKLRLPKPLLLMPLRKDQAVKQPRIDQPVVVLNLATPCLHMGKVHAKTLCKNAAPLSPKCQILKMRLGKVVGQKYEVTGCIIKTMS